MASTTVIWNADTVNAGNTVTAAIQTGGLDSIRIFNFSPYYIILHQDQAYSHAAYFDGMFEMIKPWSIVSLKIKGCVLPNTVYATMDVDFAAKYTNEPTLTALTGVTLQQSMTPLTTYTTTDLLAATNLTVTSETGSVGSSTLPPVNVGNTLSGPVNNTAVAGTAVAGGGPETITTSEVQLITSTGNLYKVYIYFGNISTTTTIPDGAWAQVTVGGVIAWRFNISGIGYSTDSYGVYNDVITIDTLPGMENPYGIYVFAEGYGSSEPVVQISVIHG